MNNISLVIPTRRVGNVLDTCLKSLEGEYGELIIVDQLWDNLSKKINWGIHQTNRDFIVVANDDIELIKGHLSDLCGPTVISPKLESGLCKTFHAHMFCLPRFVYEEVGDFCENYDGFYYDDSDYWMKLLDAGFPPELTNKVVIKHEHPATTLKTLEKQGRSEQNRDRFIERWGIQALALVESL